MLRVPEQRVVLELEAVPGSVAQEVEPVEAARLVPELPGQASVASALVAQSWWRLHPLSARTTRLPEPVALAGPVEAALPVVLEPGE